MVPLAPRYDLRLIEALRELDDPREPIAEICRRVGEVAEQLGLTRPSYVHVRRYVLAQRERRAEIRAVVEDVLWRVAAGRYVDPYRVASRLDDARAIRPLS